MMMLTVDDYYDWYLKGKSLPEIMREIEKLRKTMASLKSKMESPKYNKEKSCWPNEKADTHTGRKTFWVSAFLYDSIKL